MSAFAEYAGAVPGLMLAGCRGAGLLLLPLGFPVHWFRVWCGCCLG